MPELEWSALEERDEALDSPGMGEGCDDVAQTLATFWQRGYLDRRQAKPLMDPEYRAKVEQRLKGVGLSLAWSPYSRYYGLALAEAPAGGQEAASNWPELDRNALALLVILWAKLVLPRRLADEGRPGGLPEPTIAFDTLQAEFGKKLGGKRFEMTIGVLRRLGFVEYHRKDAIKAGPYLELLGDAQKLSSYLRQSTLARMLKEEGGDDV